MLVPRDRIWNAMGQHDRGKKKEASRPYGTITATTDEATQESPPNGVRATLRLRNRGRRQPADMLIQSSVVRHEAGKEDGGWPPLPSRALQERGSEE